MGDRLKDRVAIVTGAGRGIGRGEALLLAEEGAKVVVNDLGGAGDGTGAAKEPADAVVEEIKAKGGTAVANYDTVVTMQGAENIIKTAMDNFGRLDILVNNAGILRDRMIFNMTEEEWDIIMKVHLYGHYNCTKLACQIFRGQRSGRIINTSSEAGLGNMGQANYSTAKEGIVGFTRTVARDMGRYGVTCNCIRPRAGTRLTLTPELKAAWDRARAAGLPQLPGASPEDLETKLLPEYIAPLVVYLATDQAANINGCTFVVYGNYIGLYPDLTPIKSIYTDKPCWTLDDLCAIMPTTLEEGLVNPSPPAPPKA